MTSHYDSDLFDVYGASFPVHDTDQANILLSKRRLSYREFMPPSTQAKYV